MESSKKPNPIVASIVVIVIVAAIATGVLLLNKDKSDNSTKTQNTSAASETATTPSTSSNDNFTDGTYTANGSYRTPEGSEEIEVSLTIEENIVTAASISTDPQSEESKEYLQKFESGYSSQVIGKKISDIKLSRVAGSSLTSKGFNEAIEKIKTDAKI